MPKSKYPNELDTSVEIPAVRDNVTEYSSDIINAIRDAVLSIQKTLGTNPQGAAGNTVSNRISKALDSNGNILSSALESANVISGPVIDSNVSEVASIKESKLKLDFPTQLLQDEYSQLNKLIEDISASISEISASLTSHTNSLAVGRHNALSINVEASVSTGSDTASGDLESGTVQEVLESLFNSHINYSGSAVSLTNRAHTAGQVFFDNTDVSDIVQSDSVQDAIEDLALIESVGLRNNALNLSSNGIIRTGKVEDKYEANGTGHVLVGASDFSYTTLAGLARTTFTYDTAAAIDGDINRFDIATISGSVYDVDNRAYQIDSYEIDGSGNLTSVTVFGSPTKPASEGLQITITKGQYSVYNQNSLNCSVRFRDSRTNTPEIQVANPNSATIITSGLEASKITSTTGSFDISVDGGAAITINAYDATVSSQTIDSTIAKINDQIISQHLSFYAYKIRTANSFELALAHNVPNMLGDYSNRTLEVSAGSSNDGTSELGFSDWLDVEVEGQSGSSFHINGLIFDSFGLIKTYTVSDLLLDSGDHTVTSIGDDFISLGVRVGDLIVVSGSTYAGDDGTYRVSSFSNSNQTIIIDDASFNFAGSLDENSFVYIIRATATIGEMTFEEAVSTNSSIIFDVFVDEGRDVHYSKRLEADGTLKSSTFVSAIVDISRDFIVSGESGTLSIDTSGYATLTGPDLITGEQVFVGAPGTYNIPSASGLSYVTIVSGTSGLPTSTVGVTLYGFDEVDDSELTLCRGNFSTSLGIVLGETGDPGVPSLVDKRITGTADDSIISEPFIERYIEGPRNELRSNGIIRGCEVSNLSATASYQSFSVGAGIALVNGIRYEIPGYTDLRINSLNDFYVAINKFGEVVFEDEISDPDTPAEMISPFASQPSAHLAQIDYSETSITDLRFFVDNLDLKVTGDIIVASSQEFGHFTSLEKAVDYARRFNEVYQGMVRPSIFIKEGEFDIENTILLDFDITIRGTGPGTVLRRAGNIITGVAYPGNNYDLSTAVFIIGAGVDSASSYITHGVTLKDFVYKTSDTYSDTGVVIALTQDKDTSPNASYRVEGVSFIGSSDLEAGVVEEIGIIVTQSDAATHSRPAGLTMGNLIINNCFFRYMGNELYTNVARLDATCTLRSVIGAVSISTAAAPVAGGAPAFFDADLGTVIDYSSSSAIVQAGV